MARRTATAQKRYERFHPMLKAALEALERDESPFPHIADAVWEAAQHKVSDVYRVGHTHSASEPSVRVILPVCQIDTDEPGHKLTQPGPNGKGGGRLNLVDGLGTYVRLMLPGLSETRGEVVFKAAYCTSPATTSDRDRLADATGKATPSRSEREVESGM